VPYPESLDTDGLLRGRVDHGDGRAGYALSGELDLASADALRARLAQLAREHDGDVYLDLEDLEFLGSTGIRAVLSIHDELAEQHRRLVLVNVAGVPARALELTRVLEALNVE